MRLYITIYILCKLSVAVIPLQQMLLDVCANMATRM